MTSTAVASNHQTGREEREHSNNNNVQKITSGNLGNQCKQENGDDRSTRGKERLGELDHGQSDTSSHLLRQRNVSRPELRHAQSEILPSDLRVDIEAQRKRSQTMEIAKEHAYTRLQLELNKAQEELKLKGEEVNKLVEVRDQMGVELEELTASLFEEANNMVQDANIKRMHSEKLLKEANEQIDVLQAELKALKQLVLTSTPSSPNKHLHPQIDPELQTKKEKTEHKKPFWKTHRRSTSHHEFTKEAQQKAEAEHEAKKDRCKEIDQHCFDQFCAWRQSPLMDRPEGFLARVYREDVQPCLNFANTKLAVRLQECVGNNSLTIEPIPGDNSYPRKCRLTDNNKLCNYKIKLGDDPEWYSISQLCRNRIAAVCDYYTYVRYIQQGLVKSDDKEVFYEMVRLQKQMALARLGYS